MPSLLLKLVGSSIFTTGAAAACACAEAASSLSFEVLRDLLFLGDPGELLLLFEPD